jgi:prevent-host-death family protein
VRIASSEFGVNAGKYIEMAETEDVIIVKHGKPAAKIVRYDSTPRHIRQTPDKITSFEQLVGTLPADVDLNEARIARFSK